MELHPHFQQPELFEFVRANGMSADRIFAARIATSPGAGSHAGGHLALRGSGDPAHRRTAWRASRRGLHQVGGPARADAHSVFRQPRNIFSNLLGVTSDPLTEEEMREIAALDRNCRLIKGQVFLWKEGQSWEDLWDVNGEITPA
jgi:alcohol dehydrogenase (NADP+)